MKPVQAELQEVIYNSRNPTRRWLHTTRKNWIDNAIERLSFEGMTACEIGPGSCIYLPKLAKKAARLYVADVESQHLAVARSYSDTSNKITVLEDDISASKLPENYFDLILFSEVIEHIPDTALVLNNIVSRLKVGGVLILSTPQKYSFMELACKIAFMPGVIGLVRKIYKEPILETGHINLQTGREMRKHFSDAGLSVVEAYKCGLYIPLFSEFFGEFSVKVQRYIESKLRYTALNHILWTQCYILKRQG
ncbi:class I SAM-dependent methyltransferase [Porticoccus sp.]